MSEIEEGHFTNQVDLFFELYSNYIKLLPAKLSGTRATGTLSTEQDSTYLIFSYCVR